MLFRGVSTRPLVENRSAAHNRLLGVAGLVLLAGFLVFAFLHAGQWLVLAQPLQKARAVVVLGGDVPFRAEEAGALYLQGWAGEVWLTQGAIHKQDRELARLGVSKPPEFEYSRQVLLKLGVPALAIQVIPGHVEDTLEEVRAIAQYARSAPEAPLILVTSKYHTRRVSVIWRKVIRGKPSAIVHYTAQDPFDPPHWYSNSADALAVFREVFGILNTWAGFPIPARNE